MVEVIVGGIIIYSIYKLCILMHKVEERTGSVCQEDIIEPDNEKK